MLLFFCFNRPKNTVNIYCMRIQNSQEFEPVKTNLKAGNALFLILIAVALFAALTFVVVQSSRTGAGSTDRETSRLEASRIMAYVNQLRTATLRVSARGTEVQDIEVNDGNSTASICAPSPNCIFGAEGGGAIEVQLNVNAARDHDGNTWAYIPFSEGNTVLEVGTDAAEILLLRYFNANPTGERLCTAINEMLSIATSPIPVIDGSNASLATFPATPRQGAGCSYDGANNRYVFYATLLEN